MSGFYSIRTSSPDMWAYQIFPAGTPYSITNPQDSIGNYNDMQLTSFGATTDMLERNSVAMMNNFERLYQQYQAQIAQWSQNTYPNISGNTNFNLPGMTPGVTPGRYSSLVENDQVAGYISRLENDPLYGPELKKEITLENGEKVTYLQRLDDLIKDYLTAKTPLLKEDDFAKIKEIAGKIAKTGRITREDFLTLKEIVEKNTGELGKDKELREQREAENARKADEAKQKAANAAAPADKGRYANDPSLANVNDAAQAYMDAMVDICTNLKLMDEATGKVTQYNVMEVIETFEAKNATESGESLIEMIIDDFSDYGGGRSQKWYHFGCTDDNMKPYVDRLAKCMYARVDDLCILKNANGDLKLSKDTRTDLAKKVKNLQYWQSNANKNLTSDDKKNLKTYFTELVEAIKAAVKEAYGNDAVFSTCKSTLVTTEAECGVPQQA